jgi:(R,R)-butanediol dehydrogenase / meso-butanediol dehydrogenase / diacetyl reductase
VLWLVDRGVTDIIAVDIADERLERAKRLGARGTVNPARENLRERIAELHGKGPPLYHETVDTDGFIDAAGARTIVSDVMRMAKFHSRMVITAAYQGEVPVDLGAMLTTEIQLTTACSYPTGEMNAVVEALPRIKDTVATLISHRFTLDEVIAALGVAGTPGSAKVMIEMADEPA